jgi:hypothetical protein
MGQPGRMEFTLNRMPKQIDADHKFIFPASAASGMPKTPVDKKSASQPIQNRPLSDTIQTG